MNTSGDVAEQIVRLSLDGVEVVAKLSGTAAKELALFLVALLKSQENSKLKGKTRLKSMLKSGKTLEFFAIPSSDLKNFAKEAKKYGIVYCVARKSKLDGMCDLMVKAEDAPKINRVVEKLKLATVDMAKMENAQGAEPEAPDKNDTEKLLNDLLPPEEGKAKTASEKAPRKEAPSPENPQAAKTAKPRPSAPTSNSRGKSAGGTSKPSVRREIRQITAQRKQDAATPMQGERKETDNTLTQTGTRIHPQNSGKSKPIIAKER